MRDVISNGMTLEVSHCISNDAENRTAKIENSVVRAGS